MNRLFAALRRAQAGEDGLSLIEMMVAILLLGVAVLALASTAISSLVNLRQARDREAATNAASARVEEVRALDFEDLVHSPSDPAATALGGCFDGEPVVTNTRPTTVAAATTVDLGTGHPELDVRTYITWFQTGGDGVCDGANESERVAKRLTVEATWTDGTETRTVRQDTIVAKAERGLPVPDFDVTPANGSLVFTLDDVASDPTTERCFRHQVRNLGAEDGYDWSLDSVTGSPSPPFKATASAFTARNGNWSARAFFEYPAASTSATPPPSAELMTDFDLNGRPETTVRVDSGATANVWLCWQPKAGRTEGTIFSATMSLHSIFDGNRSEVVTHTVSVNRSGEAFYLFDPNDSVAHDRGTTQGSNLVILPYTMGPQQPDNPSSPANLGTIDYADRSRSDWDVNLDPNDLPGVWLQRGGSTDRDLAWHRQFPLATTLKGQVTLEVWVATPQALQGAPTGAVQRMSFTLQRMKANETTVDATLHTGTFEWTDNVAGWTPIEVTFDVAGGDFTISEKQKNQYLRLQLSCPSVVTVPAMSNCNVAYDNVQYPSALIVESR